MKTKSEVIKLLKEGTHCIYVDNPEKREILSIILSQAVCKTTNLTGVWEYYWVQNSFCICCEDIIPEQLEIINLSEIEPDNEKCDKCGSTDNLEVICNDCASFLPSFKKRQLSKDTNEKPYLFFECEKYYFGEEYEFSDERKKEWETGLKFTAFHINSKWPFCTIQGDFAFIRKIDHTAKYKTKLEELKQQAEKDGVNLKELL